MLDAAARLRADPLPPDGFWERREVARLEVAAADARHGSAGAAAGGPPDARGARGPRRAVDGADAHRHRDVGEARAFDQARRGLHRLEGGYAGLYALLLERLETFSGERREKVVPVEIVMKRGRAAGIRVRPRDETIGCQHLIWAGPAPAMLALCADKPTRKGRDPGGRYGSAAIAMVFRLLVTPDAIPEGMGNRIFLIGDPARPLIEDNAVAVTVGLPAPRDPGRDPDLGRVPAARARRRRRPRLPAHGAGRASASNWRACSRSCRSTCWCSGRPSTACRPRCRARRSRRRRRPRSPCRRSTRRSAPARSTSGGLPHAPGIKNLWLAGRENLPGLGLEGELVSAWSVARLVTGGTTAKRDMRGRDVLLSEG